MQILHLDKTSNLNIVLQALENDITVKWFYAFKTTMYDMSI